MTDVLEHGQAGGLVVRANELTFHAGRAANEADVRLEAVRRREVETAEVEVRLVETLNRARVEDVDGRARVLSEL